MDKRLLLLGLLLRGPLTGYDLHRVLEAHGGLYPELKRPNLYYLLDRMAGEGLLDLKVEAGARGRRGERLVYSLSEAGRARIPELLASAMTTYNSANSELDVAIVLLEQLSAKQRRSLLIRRRDLLRAHRDRMATELGSEGTRPGTAGDHLLLLADAERMWVQRALDRLERRDERA